MVLVYEDFEFTDVSWGHTSWDGWFPVYTLFVMFWLSEEQLFVTRYPLPADSFLINRAKHNGALTVVDAQSKFIGASHGAEPMALDGSLTTLLDYQIRLPLVRPCHHFHQWHWCLTPSLIGRNFLGACSSLLALTSNEKEADIFGARDEILQKLHAWWNAVVIKRLVTNTTMHVYKICARSGSVSS